MTIFLQAPDGLEDVCLCRLATSNPLPALTPRSHYIRDLAYFTIHTPPPKNTSLSLYDVQDALQSTLIEGSHTLYNPITDNLHLFRCAELLDRYFFHNTLTASPVRPVALTPSQPHHGILSLSAALSTPRYHWPHLTINIPRNPSCIEPSDCVLLAPRPRALITIGTNCLCPSGASRPVTFADAVQRLVHEMVHAYFLVHGCDRRTGCRAWRYRNGERRGRHGVHMQTMLMYVFETIQEWDDVLSGLGAEFLESRECCS